MNLAQATERARSMYGRVSDGVRRQYEGEANMADVRSPREVQAHQAHQAQRSASMGLSAPVRALAENPEPLDPAHFKVRPPTGIAAARG